MRFNDDFDREFECARCGVTKTYEVSNIERDDSYVEEWAVVWAAELLPPYWASQATPGRFAPPADRQHWEVCVDCLTDDEAASLTAYREAVMPEGIVVSGDDEEARP